MGKLGVIGGMGPEATAFFYEEVIKHTDASRDQEHLDMVIISQASMPDRTHAILTGDDARQLLANGCIAVSEGANMPSTPEAIDAFQEAGILYAPGKAANAGGVSVSGLEMTQNAQKLSWTAEEVDRRLHQIMENIHTQCAKYGMRPDGSIDYVKGANVAGFMKVAQAMMAQGLV